MNQSRSSEVKNYHQVYDSILPFQIVNKSDDKCVFFRDKLYGKTVWKTFIQVSGNLHD